MNPAPLSASTVDTSCLYVSLQIVKVHILPAVSGDRITNRDKNLMTEYVCFVMIHLQSSCPDCHVEREYIISQLRNKALF